MKREELTFATPAFGNVGPIQFIRESVKELRKVEWPSRQKTLKLTIIVIAVSTLVGVYIGVLDYLFTILTEAFIR